MTKEEFSMNWIPVTERLPEDDQTVLCLRNEQDGDLPTICWYNEDEKAFEILMWVKC